MLGRVTFPRDNLVFDVLAFLVTDFQWTPIRPDQLNFQFAVAPIELGIGGTISNTVLVTNVASDVTENLGKFALKPGLVKASAGHAGKSGQLIVGLQIIHISDRDARSMGVAGAAVRFTIIPQSPSNTDRENRDIASALDLLDDLIKVELTEGIHARGDHDHIFAAARDTVQSVQRVIECVE